MKIHTILAAAVMAAVSFSAMAQANPLNPYLPNEPIEVTKAKLALMEKRKILAKGHDGRSCAEICLRAPGGTPGCDVLLDQNRCFPNMKPSYTNSR